MKFNIIGFNQTVNYDNKHCVIHPAVRLVQKFDEPDVLWCTTCGLSYLPKDTTPEDQYISRFGPQQTRIIASKKNKKYYSQDGNEINDPDLIQEIMRGVHVISYQETKIEDNNTSSEYISRNKRLVRKT